MSDADVLIVGGGIAGLCCARHLHQAGVSCKILEAEAAVGGRVRTEFHQGFQLDLGFQVLLTAYPEAQRVLDFDRLQLGHFEPGALIRFDGKFHRFVDPLRRPQHAISTALSPVATIADKLRVALLRRRVCKATLEEIATSKEQTTISRLHDEGFTDRIITRFFKPFLGGVFLEPDLATSSRKFEFVFRMFSMGNAALPAKGIGALAQQIAVGLPADTVLTKHRVSKVDEHRVWLENGEELAANKVVIACEAPTAAKLLNSAPPPQAHGVTCIYFSADSPPHSEPILVLNGENQGPINNLCVPSQVAPGYAPSGKSLVSVTVLGSTPIERQDSLLGDVVGQLKQWYGPVAQEWEHLKTIDIPYGLPIQNPSGTSFAETIKGGNKFILCGDYLENASLQGAMVSGRMAAQEFLARQT